MQPRFESTSPTQPAQTPLPARVLPLNIRPSASRPTVSTSGGTGAGRRVLLGPRELPSCSTSRSVSISSLTSPINKRPLDLSDAEPDRLRSMSQERSRGANPDPTTRSPAKKKPLIDLGPRDDSPPLPRRRLASGGSLSGSARRGRRNASGGSSPTATRGAGKARRESLLPELPNEAILVVEQVRLHSCPWLNGTRCDSGETMLIPALSLDRHLESDLLSNACSRM